MNSSLLSGGLLLAPLIGAGIFGIWALTGTLWRGFRLLMFVIASYVMAHNYQGFLFGLLMAVLPQMHKLWASPLAVVGLTVTTFAILIATYHLLWQPTPALVVRGGSRLLGGLGGVIAGWVLGTLLLNYAVDAGLISRVHLNQATDYSAIVIQSLKILDQLIEPLIL